MERPASIQSAFARVVAPRTTLAPALVGSVLCWLAFPPVGWSYLAWIGPVPWLLLVAQEKLPGRRPYRALWLAGAVFWLLTVHWIRLPHPLNHLAWVVLAAYLGLYLPVFVALARVGVVHWRLPIVLVAPVVWTGLEWFRAHFLTGFLMGSLAHTQVAHLPILQIADQVGEYGVTFLIILVAASMAQAAASSQSESQPRPLLFIVRLIPGAIALAGTFYYGQTRIAQIEKVTSQSGPRIALIQGHTLADWKSDVTKQQQIMDEYVGLSREAVRNDPEIDLVIWPETAFRETLVTVEPGYTPPADRVKPERLTAAQTYLELMAKDLGAAVLVGIDRVHVFPDPAGVPDFRPFNSAVLVDAQGKFVGTYDKMHRVVFGEFIPFADWFPVLYRLTPLTGGIDAGSRPSGLAIENLRLSPNICYETVVPHLMRQHMLKSFDSGPPDLLVNLTNDAWYWGSSELDMHLACGVFRAIENRVPLVIAANGGLSAYVDALGDTRQVSSRQKLEVLVVEPQLKYISSSYCNRGDWFAIVCVVCCIVLALSGLDKWYRNRAIVGGGSAR